MAFGKAQLWTLVVFGFVLIVCFHNVITATGSVIQATSVIDDKEPEWVKKERAFAMPAVDEKQAIENFELTTRFGIPSKDNLRIFNRYFLSYDNRLKIPNWTMNRLTRDSFGPISADRKSSFFKPDSNIHMYFRTDTRDYSENNKKFLTKYDRGHMVPAGDYPFDQVAMDQTFTLSNVAPQTKELNRGSWVRLEKYILFLAKHETTKELIVITGPLFRPKFEDNKQAYMHYSLIGENNVAVPPEFYKVFLRITTDNRMIMDAFVMPNSYDKYLEDVNEISEYRWPVDKLDELERLTGVLFFSKINRSQVTQPASGLELGFKDKKIEFNNYNSHRNGSKTNGDKGRRNSEVNSNSSLLATKETRIQAPIAVGA